GGSQQTSLETVGREPVLPTVFHAAGPLTNLLARLQSASLTLGRHLLCCGVSKVELPFERWIDHFLRAKTVKEGERTVNGSAEKLRSPAAPPARSHSADHGCPAGAVGVGRPGQD